MFHALFTIHIYIFDFRENSSLFDFRENPCKTPKENQKNWFFFFLLPMFSRRPHLISGKIHPRLISEKIHAKPPKKTKKFAFSLLPVFSGSVLGALCFCAIGFKNFTNPKSTSFDFRENPCKTPKENQKKIAFLLLSVFSGSVLGVSLLLCHWI